MGDAGCTQVRPYFGGYGVAGGYRVVEVYHSLGA